MKNLFLLSLATFLTLFKVGMAQDLEYYVNKGHTEILVEALKYSDAGMFEEAANEIKSTNNESLSVLIKWLKLREGKGNFSEYTEFLKDYKHWPQQRLLKKFGELSIDKSVDRRDVQTFFNVGAVCKKLKETLYRLYEDDCLPQTAQGSIALLQILNANTNTEFFNEVLEKQLKKLWVNLSRERMTLIPLKLYLNEKGKVKLLIGIAKGKKVVDKRQTEKKRDWQREKSRLLKQS